MEAQSFSRSLIRVGSYTSGFGSGTNLKGLRQWTWLRNPGILIALFVICIYFFSLSKEMLQQMTPNKTEFLTKKLGDPAEQNTVHWRPEKDDPRDIIEGNLANYINSLICKHMA